MYSIPINIEKGYIMKKFVMFVIILNGIIWFGLSSLAKADDYNTAVIAHVIKEKVSGDGVDMSVLEAEISKLAYQFSLEMTSVLEKHLPSILESIANELRMKADGKYKKEISG